MRAVLAVAALADPMVTKVDLAAPVVRVVRAETASNNLLRATKPFRVPFPGFR